MMQNAAVRLIPLLSIRKALELSLLSIYDHIGQFTALVSYSDFFYFSSTNFKTFFTVYPTKKDCLTFSKLKKKKKRKGIKGIQFCYLIAVGKQAWPSGNPSVKSNPNPSLSSPRLRHALPVRWRLSRYALLSNTFTVHTTASPKSCPRGK